MTITLINPVNKHEITGYRPKRAFIIYFGACGSTNLLTYAWNLEDALDECIDWIAENKPGLLCNEMVQEAYGQAIKDGMTEDEAYEESLIDVTIGGNHGDHILSWEWGIIAENPTPAEIAAIHHGRAVKK